MLSTCQPCSSAIVIIVPTTKDDTHHIRCLIINDDKNIDEEYSEFCKYDNFQTEAIQVPTSEHLIGVTSRRSCHSIGTLTPCIMRTIPK